MNRLLTLVSAALIYLLFSIEFQIEPFNAVLFGNDFSQEGVADWFIYELGLNCLLIMIGILGCKNVTNKFVKGVFAAVIIDAVLTMFRFIIFGYYEPSYMAPITNAIPLSYIFYSYFIYGNMD